MLAAIHTALVVRDWTRLGNSLEVAELRGCYPFEIVQLQESVSRLLEAISEILGAIARPSEDPETVSFSERVSSLWRMVAGGLDEQAATLTVIPGLGAKWASRLKQHGIADLEDLAIAEVSDLKQIPGIGAKRAAAWIEEAGEMVDSHYSAFRYREQPVEPQLPRCNFPSDIDPYRLRRALSLEVVSEGNHVYRVSGGLDPHRLVFNQIQAEFVCDCVDFQKGHTCKHLLAIRLKQGDSRLQELSQIVATGSQTGSFSLLELWMDC